MKRKKLVTVLEYARLRGVTKMTVYNWIKARKIVFEYQQSRRLMVQVVDK